MGFARRVLWGVVSVALVAGVGVGARSVSADPGVVVPDAVVVRPDWTSAGVTARARGVRVEVLSERSETSRVWVHPDGVVEEEAALGAVRFADKTAADGWRDINTDLIAGSDGVVSPVAVPVGVELGSGSDELIVFDQGGSQEMGFSLPGVVLPTPVLEGPVATYPEVVPGVDVSVEVRSAGFEVLWVVKTAAGADALARAYGNGAGEVVLPTRVRVKAAVAAGKLLQGAGRIGKLGRQFTGWQAGNKFLGINSRIVNIKIGKIRIGWSQGVSKFKPKAPANWRIAVQRKVAADASRSAKRRAIHKGSHLFDHPSNRNWSRQG